MKSLFLFVPILFGCTSFSTNRSNPIKGNTYYIDAVEGDDTSDGLSKVSAWKSLRKVSKTEFLPGEKILLKKGQIWREPLEITSSGKKNNPIQFSSYGNGAYPLILGSLDLAKSIWLKEKTNIWSTQVPSMGGEQPERFFIDGKPINDEKLKKTKLQLKSFADWHWNDDRIYFFSKKNPMNLKLPLQINHKRYCIDLKKANYITISHLTVSRCRDGIRLGGKFNTIENITSSENTINGLHLTGSNNRVNSFKTFRNGLVVQLGKTGRTGHGILIDGTNNRIIALESFDNKEDGIQFGPNAGSKNQIVNALIKGNGENCIDVKNGYQVIVGGEFESKAPYSQDCILAHKKPQHLKIIGVKAYSTGKGPAISLFGGARITLVDSIIGSENSSAILIGKWAGNKIEVLRTTILSGGLKSKNLIDIRGGKNHSIKSNKFYLDSGIKSIQVATGVVVDISGNLEIKK